MKQDRWWVFALVAGLCLLSFARGVWGLGEQSLWWDESLSHYRATQPFSFILTNQILIPSGETCASSTDNHPPLYFMLLRMMVLVAGDSEFSLRFLSLLAGVLLIPLLYQCGRRLSGQAGGVFAAMLGTFSPLYLWYQQEARPYMPVTWLGLFSFYALNRLLSGWTHKRHALIWSVWYVLAVAAMLLTHYHAFFLLAAQAVIVLAWLLLRQTARRWPWLILFAVVGAVALPVAWWALRDVPIRASFPGYTFIPLGTLLIDVLRSFSVGPSAGSMPGMEWPGILAFVLAAVIVFVRRRSLPVRHAAAVLACFALPVAMIYAVSYVRPVYMNIRHLIFAAPFFQLFLALGAAQAWQTRARQWAAAGMGVLVVLMTISTWFYWTDPHYRKEDHRSWGDYLRRHVRPTDLVIVYPGLNEELYLYYASPQADWLGLPVWGGTPQDTIRYMEQALRTYDRVWVAESLTAHWASQGGLVTDWLNKNAQRTVLMHFDSSTTLVRVWAFRRGAPALKTFAPVWALHLDFDGRLNLLGLDAAPHIHAGQTLQLSMYWSAARPVEQDYRMTLALNDANGMEWAAVDYVPCEGVCPTSQWVPGPIVRDDVDLDLPPGIPPGRYQLRLSVYPADRSGPALAVYRPDDGTLQGLIVTVGEVEILPGGASRQTLPAGINKATWRDGGLRLSGYRYDSPDHLPGDVMVLHLYWQATRPLHSDRSFAVRLVDAGGAVVAEHGYPVSSRYPTSAWAKGEMIWEQYRLRIPAATPAGVYHLQLAADKSSWRWATLGTLTVAESGVQREFTPPAMQHVLGLNFGNQIELLGYDLESDAVQPGGTVVYTLYWRALSEIELDYTVFNHLVAGDGQVWGRWDGPPRDGARPTSRWVPGEVIADPRRVPVAPEAPNVAVQPFVGLYDPLTMQRLPVYDAHGQVIADHAILEQVIINKQ